MLAWKRIVLSVGVGSVGGLISNVLIEAKVEKELKCLRGGQIAI